MMREGCVDLHRGDALGDSNKKDGQGGEEVPVEQGGGVRLSRIKGERQGAKKAGACKQGRASEQTWSSSRQVRSWGSGSGHINTLVSERIVSNQSLMTVMNATI